MCNCKIKLTSFERRIFMNDIHFLLCNKCRDKNIVSATESCKKYVLINHDLQNLRFLYFENPNNNIKLYKISDVEQIAINKHGSLEHINSIKKIKKEKNNLLKLKKEKKMFNRKKKLIRAFELGKIKFNYCGDCYSYINFGKPTLEVVIKNELKKIKEIHNRRLKLANEICSLNLPFNENSKLCYEYINGTGWRNFYETVRALEIKNYNKVNKYKKCQKQIRKNIIRIDRRIVFS